MELVDRIKVVMKVNNLTAAQMADDMGVQRSNVSHVLSGRNKPSFEFLNRLLTKYPKVNAHWLITGKTQVADQATPPLEAPKKEEPVEEPISTERSDAEPPSTPSTAPSSDIDRIVIFYNNGTFKTFEQG